MFDVTWFAYPEEIVWWHLGLYYLAVAWGAFIIGCFGVGGGAVFMPLLLLLPGVTPTVAAGTVFAGSLPMSQVRTLQLAYFGRLKIRKALPLMCGALVGAMLGQLALPHLPNAAVAFLVAGLAVLAGVQTHRKVRQECRRKQAASSAGPPGGHRSQAQHGDQETPRVLGQTPVEASPQGSAGAEEPEGSPTRKARAMFSLEAEPSTARGRAAKVAFHILVGAVASFLSSISGTGGPLIIVPLWLFLDPGADMRGVLAMATPFAGTLVTFSALGALLFGQVDLGIATIFAAVATVSVCCGGLAMEKMGDSKLKQGVGGVLVAVGIAVAARTVVQLLS